MVSDLRLSTADCRLLIVDYRLLIVDCCLPIGSEIWNLKSEVPRAGGECQAQASAPSRLSLWRKPWRPKFPTGTAHGRRNGRLPIVDCCLTIADSWLLTVDCRLPTAGCLMPILDCDCRRPATARPFSIADYRPRIADRAGTRASYLESEIWNLKSEMPRARGERAGHSPPLSPTCG